MADYPVYWAIDQRVTATTLTACMTFVTYDYLLTFKQEVSYIWLAPWTPGKVLYFLVRYVVFIDLPIVLWEYVTATPEDRSCDFATQWIIWLELPAILGSYLVIGLRTWAIWNRNRACGLLLLLFFLVEVGWGIYAAFMFTSGLSADVIPSSPTPGCFETPTRAGVIALRRLYVILAANETVILLATLVQGFRVRQARSTLISVLYRDAFVASTVFSFTSVLTATMSTSSTGLAPYWFVAAYIHRAMTVVVPSRIILNIREVAYSLDGWDVTRHPDPEPVATSLDISFPIHVASSGTSPDV